MWRLKNTRIDETEIYQTGAELIDLCESEGCRKLALSLGPQPPDCWRFHHGRQRRKQRDCLSIVSPGFGPSIRQTTSQTVRRLFPKAT